MPLSEEVLRWRDEQLWRGPSVSRGMVDYHSIKFLQRTHMMVFEAKEGWRWSMGRWCQLIENFCHELAEWGITAPRTPSQHHWQVRKGLLSWCNWSTSLSSRLWLVWCFVHAIDLPVCQQWLLTTGNSIWSAIREYHPKFPVIANTYPTFLYGKGQYDAKNPSKGLFKGELLLKVWLQ